MFLHESQNEIHRPTIISVTNNLSLILVSDTNKCAYVSKFLITSARPALAERKNSPHLKLIPFDHRHQKDTAVTLKKRCFCMKQRISSLDRDMFKMQEEQLTNIASRKAVQSHAKFPTMLLVSITSVVRNINAS